MTLFQPLDFFMVRSPLLPVDRYRELFHQDCANRQEQIEEAIARLARSAEDPVVRESLAIASLSLLDALPNLSQTEPSRKREQAVRGLLRYLLRMTTRSTPFGAFSGVAYGTLGEQTDLRLKAGSLHKKRTRPDMEWLLKVVQILESRYDVVRQLHVQTNPAVQEAGTRIQLPYLTKYGQQAQERAKVSIRSTPVVLRALELAGAKAIPFEELVDRLQAEFAGAPREKISQFARQLFQQEFLISDLRPPLMIESPFQHVLDRLQEIEGIDELRSPMREVARSLDEYDKLRLGEGEEMYRKIVERMKDIVQTSHPLQVDLALAKQQMTLPRAVAEEAAKAGEVLWRLSPKFQGNSNLQDYRMAFLERYGYGREIPLLDLLDEDRGLGVPKAYGNQSASAENSLYDSKRNGFLVQAVGRALRRRERELVLTEELISQWESAQPDAAQAPLSLELYFNLVASSQAAVDRGEFELYIGGNPGSRGAGQSFGRFVDLLDPELIDSLKEVHEREQQQRTDAVFAELVMLPNDGRISNVVLAMNVRPYEIAIGCTSSKKDPSASLSLSDLVVGLREDGFYLRSRSLGRVVIPTKAHMLNPHATTFPVYRFLHDLGTEAVRNWSPFAWGPLEEAPFLPRVRYGKAILSPATWKVNRFVLPLEANAGTDTFAKAFTEWREEWEVPRFAYLTMSVDQRILFDFDHPLHQEEIRREFEKMEPGRYLEFTEAGPVLDQAVLEGPDGAFVSEYVFPLIRKHVPTQVKPLPEMPVLPDRERLRFPGSDWLFLKCYGVSGREEEFLGWHLYDFCVKAVQEELADRWFFMRYADPKPHVRLRFQGEPSTLSAALLPRIHDWVRQLQEQGLLSRLVIDTYDPEIERYGGAELIDQAERLFAAESLAVAEWIGNRRARNLQIPLDTLSVIGVVDLLENFSLSREEQLSYLKRYTDTQAYQSDFRAKRSELLFLADSHDEWGNLRSSSDGEIVWRGLQKRKEAVQAYGTSLAESREKESVIASVVHLFANRLLGLDREAEKRMLGLAYLTLNALSHLHARQKEEDL